MSTAGNFGFPQKVGQFEVNLGDIVRHLRFHLTLQPAVVQVAAKHLVRAFAEKEGLSISDEELTKAVEEYRANHGLFKASDTMEYLELIGLTTTDFEWEIETTLLMQKVQEKLFAEQVQGYFVENQLDFEQIEINHIVVKDDGLANELLSQMREDRVSFRSLAKKHTIDALTKRNGGYVGWVRRGSNIAEIESVLFAAKPGEVKGPFKVPAGYELVEVLDVEKPESVTPAIREEILAILFQREFINKYLPPLDAGKK